ncbi:MAG: AmmeMemoRadiSam system protein B [Mangrovibacterium sp.]
MKLLSYSGCLAVVLLTMPGVSRGQPAGGYTRIRLPAVAGSFYPAEPNALISQLAGYLRSAGKSPESGRIAALIVPHAGYVYSGEVAASAYAVLEQEQAFERVFVIGTSHHVWLKGGAVDTHDGYRTPLGVVPVDTELVGRLIRSRDVFEERPDAFEKEHSIEVQLPFLQYRLKHGFKLVPVLVGQASASSCREIARTLRPYFNERNLFVVSSDFSHYPGYEGALKADGACGEAIQTNSADNFIAAVRRNEAARIPGLATSACGQGAIMSLLGLSGETQGMEVKHLRYMNSGDSPFGDRKRVVGYHAFAFLREEQGASFSLDREEKLQLLKLAREAIRDRLSGKPLPEIREADLSGQLKVPCGAFVSIYKKGKLRGCIGRMTSPEPLYQVVQKMAVAAATGDSRFEPLRLSETGQMELELSVLSPLRRISSISEFQPGKHGIYMVRGNRSGTLLPQVGTETGWSREELLDHCARYKAGIGRDGWKHAELYIYEALVFGEKDLKPGQ